MIPGIEIYKHLDMGITQEVGKLWIKFGSVTAQANCENADGITWAVFHKDGNL